jgi:hypothetical protein
MIDDFSYWDSQGHNWSRIYWDFNGGVAPGCPLRSKAPKVSPSEYFTVNFVHSLKGNNNPQAVLALLENCWVKLQPAPRSKCSF